MQDVIGSDPSLPKNHECLAYRHVFVRLLSRDDAARWVCADYLAEEDRAEIEAVLCKWEPASCRRKSGAAEVAEEN